MANKKETATGIGKNANPGVMHNPQPSRARTCMRVVCIQGYSILTYYNT